MRGGRCRPYRTSPNKAVYSLTNDGTTLPRHLVARVLYKILVHYFCRITKTKRLDQKHDYTYVLSHTREQGSRRMSTLGGMYAIQVVTTALVAAGLPAAAATVSSTGSRTTPAQS